MNNTFRALSVSSLVLLASCLPAAEPVDNDSACSSSWKTYDSSWWAWDPEEHSTTAVLTTEVLDPEFDYNVPYTTLCDGYRRAVVSRATTPTITYDPPTTITAMQYYPEPEPTCTIGEAACTNIFSSYYSASSVWVAEGNGVGSLSPRVPHCTTYRPCDSPEWPGNSYCFIQAYYDMKLFYWPVSTTSGDFCTSSGSTVLALPTSPPQSNSVVTEGKTFTSPTNYISFASLEAALLTRRNKDRPKCGTKVYENVVVPVTGAFTTKGPDGLRSSLNMEDLNTLKYEDFKAQRRCRNNACTVIEGFYTPELALPTEVLDLEPVEWKAAGCRGTDVGTSWYHPSMVPLVTPAPVAKGKLL
ncbi:hypothetical protein Q7P36_008908 [Cladosporium allicinum]